MSQIAEEMNISEKFEHLFNLIKTKRFLIKEGLSDIPFFICDFSVNESEDMKRVQKQLSNRLEQQGISVLEIDLYELSIELLRTRGILEDVFQMEPTTSKEELTELLQNVLDPEAHLTPLISSKMEAADFDVLFINGVGEVYPFIRSNNVLNNLHSKAKEKPTVVFFPGKYTQTLDSGSHLTLFNCLNDRYYKGFNIFSCDFEH